MKKQILKFTLISAIVLSCNYFVKAEVDQEDNGGGPSVSCPTGDKYKCTSKETSAGTVTTRKGEGEVIITIP